MRLSTIKAEKFSNIEDFIDEIKLILKDIGVIDIIYTLLYSDKEISNEANMKEKGYLVDKKIDDYLVQGNIVLKMKNNRGEKKLINKIILNILVIQILNYIHSKIRIINENFIQIAKMQTYMTHDLKNVLQFFQTMQYNVKHIKNNKEKDEFIDFLQNSTEPINIRVNKILTLLKTNSLMTPNKNSINKISISALFKEYGKRYNLNIKIEGDERIDIHTSYMQTIINNILENIADKQINEGKLLCKVMIKKYTDNISITITDNGTPFKDIRRITEPFYTTKSEGTGIGFYQVNSLIRLINGTIKFKNIDNKPYTYIVLSNM